jgi:hypothetical protein
MVLARGASLPGGASVTLAWNPSPDSNVTGYRLYYGTASHNYTNTVPADLSATATVAGLAEGATYVFAVTAINNLGMESDYSNEISYTVPSTGPRLEVRIDPNQQVILRITGQPGHTYEIQATQNFTNWNAISVVTLDAGGSLDFIDVAAAGQPSRSYRLREILLPRLQLLRSASSPVVLRITGQAGHTYEVQATQDLINWNVIGNVTLGAGATYDFSDAKATGQPSRFYRLREILLPRLQLLRSPSSPVVLRMTGQAGHAYEVQATQDLINWNVIGNVTLDAGATFDFSDTGATGQPSRFYRLRESP